MNKLALVGKDISHSRSPEIYRKLISISIKYDLLDYQNEFEIPTAEELLIKYDGINVTSPYKKHFLTQVEVSPLAKEIGAINCLKKKNGKLFGENTDYLAILDILKKMQDKYGEIEVVVLGDGVMANVVKLALAHLHLNFSSMSRKKTKDFNQLNLEKSFQNKMALPLVINTCAREFIFSGEIPAAALFWDFNYNLDQHSNLLSNKIYKYLDGLEMLERQAFYAVSFWSN